MRNKWLKFNISDLNIIFFSEIFNNQITDIVRIENVNSTINDKFVSRLSKRFPNLDADSNNNTISYYTIKSNIKSKEDFNYRLAVHNIKRSRFLDKISCIYADVLKEELGKVSQFINKNKKHIIKTDKKLSNITNTHINNLTL